MDSSTSGRALTASAQITVLTGISKDIQEDSDHLGFWREVPVSTAKLCSSGDTKWEAPDTSRDSIMEKLPTETLKISLSPRQQYLIHSLKEQLLRPAPENLKL